MPSTLNDSVDWHVNLCEILRVHLFLIDDSSAHASRTVPRLHHKSQTAATHDQMLLMTRRINHLSTHVSVVLLDELLLLKLADAALLSVSHIIVTALPLVQPSPEFLQFLALKLGAGTSLPASICALRGRSTTTRGCLVLFPDGSTAGRIPLDVQKTMS